LKSELQYCNLFRNGSATKQIGPQNDDFSTVVAMATSLEKSKKAKLEMRGKA